MKCTEVAYINPNITVESFTKKDGHVVYICNYQGNTFFYLKTLQLLLEFLELGDYGTDKYPRFEDEDELNRFLDEEVEPLISCRQWGVNMTDKQFIEYLIQKFSERRHDIVDMCEEYLETGKVETKPESRLVYAEIPDTDIKIEYDTFLTQLSFSNTDWEVCVNHKFVK